MPEPPVGPSSDWAKLGDKALETIKSAGKFIERIVGPASDELAGLLTDQVKFWRARNLNRLASKFEVVVQERGFNEEAARHLPFGTAYLSLERASLEESEIVQELWAKLFANALDPNRDRIISKIHIDVLGSLTELDAKLLMAKKEWDDGNPPFRKSDGQFLSREEINEAKAVQSSAAEIRYGDFASTLSERELSVSLYNLIRLQLLDEPFAPFSQADLRMWSLGRDDPDLGGLERVLEKLADATRSVDIEALAKDFGSGKHTATALCRGVLSEFEFTALGSDFMAAVSS
jgi:hypothetical protein